MKKVFFLICTLGLLISSKAQENIIEGELMLMLHHREDPAQFLIRVNEKHPSLVLRHKQVLSADINIHLFSYDPFSNSSAKALNAVIADDAVAIAQFNHNNVGLRDSCPDDPNFGNQWAFLNDGTNGGTGTSDIDACAAWEITTGGYTASNDRIVVAVIDGGFDLTQSDLDFYQNPNEIAGNSMDDDLNGYVDDVNGWNASNNNGNTQGSSWDSHATHVSGTVGAKGNNNNGVTGVNWDVEIMPIKGSSSNESVVVAAYSYVLKMRRMYNQSNGANGAFVVATNSSFGVDLGDPADYPIWCAMYDSLGREGILSAGATANANYDVDTQGDIPTACPSDFLITVTNTRSNDTKATAGFGATTIDLGAPGTNIYSTLPNNTYGNLSGTSMATPHVAGTIALMWSAACEEMIVDYKNDPDALALIMKDFLLLNGVDPVTALQGITVTEGRLNLFKAVQAVGLYADCLQSISEEEDFSFEIYPNPGDGLFTLEIPQQLTANGTVEVYNSTGQLVLVQENRYQNRLTIDLGQFPKGIYSLRMRTAENSVIFGKIILQ